MSGLGKEILTPRIWRSVSFFYVHDIVALLSTAILTRWWLNYFDTEQYDFMVAVASAVGYMTLLDFGLGQTITKYVAEHAVRDETKKLNQTINTTLAMYVVLGLLGGLVSLVCMLFLHRFFDISAEFLAVARVFFLLAALKTCIGLPLGMLGGVCFGMGRIDLYNTSRILSKVLNFVLVWLALAHGANLAQMEGLTMVVPLAGGLFNVLWIKHIFPSVRFSPTYVNRGMVRKLLSFSVYFMINQMIVLLVFHTDNLVISQALGLAGFVRVYQVNQLVIQVGLQVTFKLSDSLYPTWSGRDAIGDLPGMRRIYLMATRYSVSIALVAMLLVIFYAEWLIAAWTGRADVYAGAAVTWTLAGVIVLHTPIHVASGLVAACGDLKRITPWAIAEGLLNVVLSIWWVRIWGIWGVALATLTSMLVTTGFLVPAHALKLIGQRPVSYLGRGVLPGVLTALPVWATGFLLAAYWPCASGLTALWHASILALLFAGCLAVLHRFTLPEDVHR